VLELLPSVTAGNVVSPLLLETTSSLTGNTADH